MKFMRHVTAHFFWLVFQQTWVFITDRLTVVFNSELVCSLHYLRHYSRCYRADCCLWGMCQAHFVSLESPTDVTGYFRSSRWGRVSPVLSVILVFYIWDHNSASGPSLCRFQFMSDPLFWGLGRTFHFLRLKHKENLLGFILSRIHWLSCIGFCFICSFCMKSASKRVSIFFTQEPQY